MSQGVVVDRLRFLPDVVGKVHAREVDGDPSRFRYSFVYNENIAKERRAPVTIMDLVFKVDGHQTLIIAVEPDMASLKSKAFLMDPQYATLKAESNYVDTMLGCLVVESLIKSYDFYRSAKYMQWIYEVPNELQWPDMLDTLSDIVGSQKDGQSNRYTVDRIDSPKVKETLESFLSEMMIYSEECRYGLVSYIMDFFNNKYIQDEAMKFEMFTQESAIRRLAELESDTILPRETLAPLSSKLKEYKGDPNDKHIFLYKVADEDSKMGDIDWQVWRYDEKQYVDRQSVPYSVGSIFRRTSNSYKKSKYCMPYTALCLTTLMELIGYNSGGLGNSTSANRAVALPTRSQVGCDFDFLLGTRVVSDTTDPNVQLRLLVNSNKYFGVALRKYIREVRIRIQDDIESIFIAAFNQYQDAAGRTVDKEMAYTDKTMASFLIDIGKLNIADAFTRSKLLDLMSHLSKAQREQFFELHPDPEIVPLPKNLLDDGRATPYDPIISTWFSSGLLDWGMFLNKIVNRLDKPISMTKYGNKWTKETFVTIGQDTISRMRLSYEMAARSEHTSHLVSEEQIAEFEDAVTGFADIDYAMTGVQHYLRQNSEALDALINRIVSRYWKGIPIPEAANFLDFQQKLLKRFSPFITPSFKNQAFVNACNSDPEDRWQKHYQAMMPFYFTLKNSEKRKGLFLYWSPGAGKTCAINSMISTVLQTNIKNNAVKKDNPNRWRIVYVTRRTLTENPFKDFEKLCLMRHFRNHFVPLYSLIEVMSFRELYGMLKSHPEKSKLFIKRINDKEVMFADPTAARYDANNTTQTEFEGYVKYAGPPAETSWMRDPNDVWYRTLVVIDEGQLLYDTDVQANELGIGEVYDKDMKRIMSGGDAIIHGLQQSLWNSYARNGADSGRIICSSGTPFDEDEPMRMVQWLNSMICDPNDRLPEDMQAFKQRYFNADSTAIKTKEFFEDFLPKIRGLVSYLDNKDPSEFAALQNNSVKTVVVEGTSLQNRFTHQCFKKRSQKWDYKSSAMDGADVIVDPALPVSDIKKNIECSRRVAAVAELGKSSLGQHSEDKTKGVKNRWMLLDDPNFNPVRLRQELPNMSTKYAHLMKTIAEVDRIDMEHEGHKYKHCIYSSLSLGFGGKFAASVMSAHGYKEYRWNDDKHIFEPNHRKTDDPSKGGFALLSTHAYYGDDFKLKNHYFREKGSLHRVKMVIDQRGASRSTVQTSGKAEINRILGAINDIKNKHGDEIRFIILGGNFREGIDLFDVKYGHIMESPGTEGKRSQTIGRFRRLCGSRNIAIPGVGFPELQVYLYDDYLYRGAKFKSVEEGKERRESLNEIYRRVVQGISEDKARTYRLMSQMIYIAAFDRRINQAFHENVDVRVREQLKFE
jgi:hypothetical protein